MGCVRPGRLRTWVSQGLVRRLETREPKGCTGRNDSTYLLHHLHQYIGALDQRRILVLQAHIPVPCVRYQFL